MTTTNITLRAAEHPADYPQIARLFNTVGYQPLPGAYQLVKTL